MYNQNRIIAIIPARANSKGVKNKNLISLGGKPLISYTISAAKASRYIDEVLVTTDGENISEYSKSLGASVPFLRPAHLATDTSKTIDAVHHAVEYLKAEGNVFSSVVLLQPTTPFRTTQELDKAIELHYSCGKSVVSVSPAKENPVLMRTLNADQTVNHLLSTRSDIRRQDFQKFYIVDGNIYINSFSDISLNTSFNDNEVAFISESVDIDIDSYEDLEHAELHIKKQQDVLLPK